MADFNLFDTIFMLETFDLSTLHKTMRTHFPYCQKYCKINVSHVFHKLHIANLSTAFVRDCG